MRAEFSEDSGVMMWARLTVGAGASGLGLRAAGDGLLRFVGAGCAGRRQQQSRAASTEVSRAVNFSPCKCAKGFWHQTSHAPFVVMSYLSIC